jgi:hypothetical protein
MVEVLAHMREYSRQCAGKVVHPIFQRYRYDTVRQHLLPMPCQPCALGHCPAQIGKIMGIRVAAMEAKAPEESPMSRGSHTQ